MKRTLALVLIPLAAIATSGQAPGGTSKWESMDWGQLPAGLQWEAASQISTTPEGDIVVLRRANPFFVVLKPSGELVRTWGENLFRTAHGLRVDAKGFLW